MNSLDATFLTALVFGYIAYRQCITRPISRRDFILPAIGALYLSARYLGGAGSSSALFIQAVAVIGISSGLLAGRVVRLWRDESSGLIFQRGGERYAAILVGLLAIRIIWHVIVSALGVETSVATLNDGLIALALGNYLGRSISVGIRALRLGQWKPAAIPAARTVRRARRSS